MSFEVGENGEIAAALRTVPGLVVPGHWRATRLSGLSNRVYRVDGPGLGVVVRLPRAETAGLVDRKAEARNARIAEDLGIGAPILHLDPQTGVMVTQLVPGVRPLKAGAVSAAQAARAGRTFARLHGSGRRFAGVYRPSATIGEAIGGLRDDRILALGRRAAEAAQRLEATAGPPVPCHCDPVPDNALDDGKLVRLVDWEYSAMADPAWDLAYFVLETGLDVSAQAALLDAYSSPQLAGRVEVMKPICDMVSGLWALGQAAAGNPAADFNAYGMARLARAESALAGE
ncbi:phosphotransferase family protein [Stappia sp. F7233]|uniref:Phosphotransferase family protein n=1 Tax=Stappia albiluteola TaxID=2758565 RepID=A0A839AFL1_9HYPH|nr:choline/ethanolamine kinase family protein [Stappia albiluteola]MBA5777905.1 phosphotransferase family protein [Stappia albiluteola]